MGLQDTFFKLRLPFTSEKAQKLSAQISEVIYYHAIQTSLALAERHSPFPAFPESRYAEGALQVQLARDTEAHLPELNFDWDALARNVKNKGIRNSLLIAIAPTATIASIVGSFESIEPQISNFFKRETLSGEFLQVNKHLITDLKKLNLWNPAIKSKIIANEGSIQEINEIPTELKELYRTVWEISQKDLIEMASARSTFICQSQSLNLFLESPTLGKLSSMYMYAWKQGIKTTYYLRSRAKTSIKKTTVEAVTTEAAISCSLENPESCESCP
jgi:ribonucleoside-diphosphate reductase alpha chain